MSGRGRPTLTPLLGAAFVVVCCVAFSAHGATPGDQQTVEGHVLSVEGGDVIVDLAARHGLVEGDVIELWRRIELTHPVTRRPVRDRYRIGELKIVQVRERLAVSVVEGKTKRAPQIGDAVVLRREAPEPPRRTAAKEDEAAPAHPKDAETAKVMALFDSLSHATLVDRIRAYVAFVRENPTSPYARVLHEDAVQYHRLLRAQTADAAPRPFATGASAPSRTSVAPPYPFDPPARALAGRTFDVGLHLDGSIAGAVLHVRHPSEVGYLSMPMRPAGSGHHVATISADRMRPPGVEYFIEKVDAAGQSSRAVGSEDSPFTIEIEPDPDAAPEVLQQQTTVSLLSDYADYNTLGGEHDDWTFQTEGLLGMRFADVGLRAMRTGFGVYRGEGGSLRELDDLGLEPRKVGLTYGYLEGEFAFAPTTALVARAVSGLTEEGVAFGALALVRIGSDLRTNLALGGEVLGGVGVRSIAQLEIKELPRVPFLVRTEVSNQPAGTLTGRRGGSSRDRGELGLRTIVQGGYELSPGLVAALRASAQGRTIDHYGFGFGGAVSYTW